jgi:hypothetical protein
MPTEAHPRIAKSGRLPHCGVRGNKGVALVLTLALLILITAIILAFFSQATLHRQISFSSSGQNRANLLSQSALDTIVADLQGEIVAGSGTNSQQYSLGTGTAAVYIPLSNQTMAPFRTVANTQNPPDLTNLIKASLSGSAEWSGTAYSVQGPVRAAAGSAYLTTTPSLGGRFIPAQTWNKPLLLSGTTMPADFPIPSWIMITRSGPVQNAAALPPITTLRDSSPQNMEYVIGRYAYTIYDVGGLLDVNIAGNSLSQSVDAQRGRLHEAMLGEIPLTGDNTPGSAANLQAASNLVNWRGVTSGSTWLFSATNSFLTVSSTAGQAFVSRQDLIQYFENAQTDTTDYPNGLSLSALQYLTVFSRELNQPSYTPLPLTTVEFPTVPPSGSRARLQAATLTGTNGPYGLGNGSIPSGQGYENTFNPSLLYSNTGGSVFKERFPLSRLAWITSNGPSSTLAASDPTIIQLLADGVSQKTITDGNATNIHLYFGLTWEAANHLWVYNSPEGTGLAAASIIKPLSSIPASRTTGPDFFETLLASISVGSLGRDAGPPAPTGKSTGGVLSNVYVEDQNIYRHILQIGANIIDQARPDDFPTAFIMGSSEGKMEVYGVKNLPYLTRICTLSVDDYAHQSAAVYLAPEVWNPNQQVNLPPSSARPTNFRIRGCSNPDAPEVSGPCTVFAEDRNASQEQSRTTDLSTVAITFNLPAITPTLLTAANSTGGAAWTNNSPTATTPDPVYCTPDGNAGMGISAVQTSEYLYGFLTGTYPTTDLEQNSSTPGFIGDTWSDNEGAVIPPGDLDSFVMEYYSSVNNQWYPYAVARDLTAYMYSADAGPFASVPPKDPFHGHIGSSIHIDPRTDRFGMFGNFSNSGLTAGVQYDPFTSQTLLHCSGSPPSNGSADPRFVGQHLFFTVNTANTNGGSIDTAGGAFHLQPLEDITNTGDISTQGLYLETIADNVGPSFPDNSSVSLNYYYDPDGTVRPGAGAYRTPASNMLDGNPMAMAQFGAANTFPGSPPSPPYTMQTSSEPPISSQPIVLDRPFRSVAELGYVFRDVPWKDIDLFTTASGDAALLDAFSITDTTPAVTSGSAPLVAGKINLNSQNAVVLQALLMGAIKDDSSTGSTNLITQADAAALAKLLIARTSGTAAGLGPLTNKADLTLKFAGDLTGASASTPDWIVKARREAAIRALSDAGTVRTWNLLIDVVVQAGKYSSTAQSGSQFVVEGEKHCWLHVALDRFTGQVVDEFLEPVYD